MTFDIEYFLLHRKIFDGGSSDTLVAAEIRSLLQKRILSLESLQILLNGNGFDWPLAVEQELLCNSRNLPSEVVLKLTDFIRQINGLTLTELPGITPYFIIKTLTAIVNKYPPQLAC